MSDIDKDKKIIELEALLKKANEKIEECERRLGLNSSNSSKPRHRMDFVKNHLQRLCVPRQIKVLGDKQATLVTH